MSGNSVKPQVPNAPQLPTPKVDHVYVEKGLTGGQRRRVRRQKPRRATKTSRFIRVGLQETR
jgi:hypothetical protein